MPYMKDYDNFLLYGKKYSVSSPPHSVDELADFVFKVFVFRGETATLRMRMKRFDSFVNTIDPSIRR